ncbi:hypothetical protein CHS0354_018973 [Potamilus streckersoni]|uniref:Uncharacterized protein n=1 Tax=Potamilus streckersoni TaxID=2493646 RepID=A0AAE0SLU2_9BIVA|nr:hypothetical protein CHS0354_018973 [Potamilus streckersoni]
MQVLGLENLEDSLVINIDDWDNEDKVSYPRKICKKVVDIFWKPIPEYSEPTSQASFKDMYLNCICKKVWFYGE